MFAKQETPRFGLNQRDSSEKSWKSEMEEGGIPDQKQYATIEKDSPEFPASDRQH